MAAAADLPTKRQRLDPLQAPRLSRVDAFSGAPIEADVGGSPEEDAAGLDAFLEEAMEGARDGVDCALRGQTGCPCSDVFAAIDSVNMRVFDGSCSDMSDGPVRPAVALRFLFRAVPAARRALDVYDMCVKVAAWMNAVTAAKGEGAFGAFSVDDCFAYCTLGSFERKHFQLVVEIERGISPERVVGRRHGVVLSEGGAGTLVRESAQAHMRQQQFRNERWNMHYPVEIGDEVRLNGLPGTVIYVSPAGTFDVDFCTVDYLKPAIVAPSRLLDPFLEVKASFLACQDKVRHDLHRLLWNSVDAERSGLERELHRIATHVGMAARRAAELGARSSGLWEDGGESPYDPELAEEDLYWPYHSCVNRLRLLNEKAGEMKALFPDDDAGFVAAASGWDESELELRVCEG